MSADGDSLEPGAIGGDAPVRLDARQTLPPAAGAALAGATADAVAPEPAAPAAPPRDVAGETAVADRMPGWVFPVAVAWLALTLAVFIVYETVPAFRHAFPTKLGPYIPVTVPWFGALGGCLVSLAGISDHNKEWDTRYDYWHPVRPLVGAVTGAIGCLLLLVTTQLATKGPVNADAAFFDAVAFVFGYAEAAFRGLITTLTDVILKPGTPSSRK
jgi:hypothetical protein